MNHIWSIIYPYLKDFITSNFFAGICAALITVYCGFKTFLSQQRISRIQKIYYEESLLDQLNHLDDMAKITDQNFALFNNAINLILNDLKINKINSFTMANLNELAKQIMIPPIYQSSKKEILITLFKNNGYIIHQWLFKYDTDHIEFNLFIRECIWGIANWLQLNSPISEKEINEHDKEIKNFYALLKRHFALSYLLNKLVSKIALMDFKSREDIIKSIANDTEIKNILEKTDEAFKILFGYFKVEKDAFLSYLISENGYRFKFQIDNKIKIERVRHDLYSDLKQMIIIKDDRHLSGSSITVNGKNISYPEIQLDMANLCAFNEKPQFYPEVESFVS